MNTLSLRIRYRPLRIGWCVRNGNFDDVGKALRLTHTFCGGRYNPIIPVDDTGFAKQLVDVFRVDILYPASDDPLVKDFIKQFKHLPWPSPLEELFIVWFSRKTSTILDVQHPIHLLYEEHLKNNTSPKITSVIFEWDKNDPLSDIMLVTFGAFPSKEEIGIDYSTYYKKVLNAELVSLDINTPLPSINYTHFTPSRITTYRLIGTQESTHSSPGFYVGSVNNFNDIVNFWNLRASAIELLFYDPNHSKRLDPAKDAFLRMREELLQHQEIRDEYLMIWRRTHEKNIDTSMFNTNILKHAIAIADKDIWNGFNIKPPLKHFEEQTVLGMVSEGYNVPTITFQLPPKPFYNKIAYHGQKLVVSINPLIDISKPENFTFRTPYIPELNEYFGRECCIIWNIARAETDGMGVVVSITEDQLILRALEYKNLISEVFEVFGMEAKNSQAGLIAKRLIQQMGGLQDCRVFKIAGVRKLIERYAPYKSFTISEALKDIGPNFSQYQNLFIEQRPSNTKLEPKDVFKYLLEKGVLSVGLNLKCPDCQLNFWLSLDNVKTTSRCEFCGKEFNIASQLRDCRWAYRRSGLFGKEDHQEGAIPVALTLQQLDTILYNQWRICTTAMEITPTTAFVNKCETDLILITQNYEGHVQLLIGECKSNKEIEEEDVLNLKRIADVFPQERFEVFIIFSKTTSFTPKEIECCKVAQDPYRHRLILLSGRELEPYYLYERTAKEFYIDEHAATLEEFAKNTHNIYFDPKTKKISTLLP